MKHLSDEKGIKAVTVCFTDLEALPHARLRQEVPVEVGGQPDLRRLVHPRFSRQAESDLRLASTGRALLAAGDVFGPGKVLVFGDVEDQDGSPYAATCAPA